MKRVLSFFFVVLAFLFFTAPDVGAAPLTGVGPRVESRSSFSIPIVGEIGEQIGDLVGVNEIEPEETYGTKALGFLLQTLKIITGEGTRFVNNFAALPELSFWLEKQYADETVLVRWMTAGQLLLFVLICALGLAWLMDFLIMPIRRKIGQKTFKNGGAKAFWIFVRLLVSLLPVFVFLSVSLLLLGHENPTKFTNFIVITVVYSLATYRLIKVVARFFLAPRTQNMRIVPVSSASAYSLFRIIKWLSGIGLFGYAVVEIGKAVAAPAAAISAFSSLVSLAIVMLAVVIVLKKKSYVSTFIRGNLSAAQTNISVKDNFRLWLARVWHSFVILYLVVGYLVMTFGPESGSAFMQKGTIGTLVSLFLMNLIFHFADRSAIKKSEIQASTAIYKPVFHFLFRAVVLVLAFAGVVSSWGVDIAAVVSSAWGQRILGSIFSIVSTLLLVVSLYEMLSRFIERSLNKKDDDGNVIEANSRARTLLPMIKKVSIIILAVIVGLVTLSEFGINIAPILAGAGVLGVAVGFGSQTLVKDFLTGLSIILEDTISVGDTVEIAGMAGVVEDISVRTIRLRSFDGAFHVVPFSAITTITNFTKTFSYAVIDLGVAYDSDLDKVIDLIEKTGAEMREDPEHKADILDKIEVSGVEALGDFAVTVRSRIKTKAGKQHAIRRAYLLKIKKKFDQAGVEIPFPTVTQIRRNVIEDPAPVHPALSPVGDDGDAVES